jgi:hypothetical protein
MSVGIVAFALIACWPVIAKRYGFVDDYTLLWEHEHGGNIAKLGIAQGRPVAALMHYVAFGLLHGITGFQFLRLVSVLATAATAVVIARAMLGRGYSLVSAWMLGVGLFWLPSTAIMVSWSILFFSPVAALAAAGAAVLFVRADELRTDDSLRSWLQARSIASFLLLSAGVLTYQPAAMVFWPVVFLLLVAPGRDTAWRALVRPVAAAVFLALAAFVMGYIGLKVGAKVVSQTSGRAALATDAIAKLRQLRGVVIPWGIYPWTLAYRRDLGRIASVIFAFGLYLSARGRPLDRFALLFLAGAAMVLGWLANLVIAENATTARTLAGVMLAQVVFVVIIVDAFARRFATQKVLISAIALAATVFSLGWMTHVLNGYTARPAEQEYTRAVAGVGQVPVDARGVRAIPANVDSTLGKKYIDGEFGNTTGSTFWALQGFTELAYRDAHGVWPPAGMFVYPTSEQYDAGVVREHPAAGTPVLDYQRISNPGSASPFYSQPGP